MALATGQITIVDLTDLPSLQGYLISNKPKIQFLDKDNNYSPVWSAGSPLTVFAEVYTVGSGANLITDSRVTSILWYKDGVVIDGATVGITLVPAVTGNLKNTSISINQNLLTTGSPAMKISADILYQHTATVSATPIKLEIDFGLSQQGQTGAKGETGLTGLGAMTAILTNESSTLAANSAGTVSNYAPALTDIYVYEGGSLLTYDPALGASGTWKAVATPTGITMGALADQGTFARTGTFSAMGGTTASVSYLITGKRTNGTSFSDMTVIQTITKSSAGVDGVSPKEVTLTGPQVFKLDEAGVPTPSSITLTLAKQNTSSTTYDWKFGLDGAAATTVLNGTNFAGTTISGDTITITGNSANWGAAKTMTVQLIVDGVSDTITITRVQDGTTAKALSLSATSNTMTFDYAGVAKPTSQTISFVASLSNLTGTASFVATPYDSANTALTLITLGGTGNTRTLTQAQWPATAVRVVVVGSLSGYSDTMTVVKLQEIGGVSGYLTNESITLAADNSGAVVGTLATLTAGTFKVFFGTTALASGVTFAKANEVNCTSAIVTATGATYGNYNLVTIGAGDTASVDLTATYNGVTITKKLTISKSKAGTDAVSIVVWTPLGDVFKSENGSTPTALTIQCDLYKGGSPVTGTYSWFIQEGLVDEGAGSGWKAITAGYLGISGQAGATLTVPASAVPALENFKCKAVYGSTYYGTATLTDMTDPYTVNVICLQGNTFFNGGGATKTLQAIVYQNGAEIDGATLTYTWKKYVGGALSGTVGTTKTITVSPADVGTEATYTCDVS